MYGAYFMWARCTWCRFPRNARRLMTSCINVNLILRNSAKVPIKAILDPKSQESVAEQRWELKRLSRMLEREEPSDGSVGVFRTSN